MKAKNLIYLVIAFSISIGCTTHKEKSTLTYIDPLIGTDYTGNTYPGAQMPFGAVQLSPDNGYGGWDRIAGYFYPDSTIAGFSHTHLSGTGAGDLYDIMFMPAVTPELRADSTSELGLYSLFSHENEKVEAGYYQVLLSTYNINVELTATPRCGIQRYTFPEEKTTGEVYLNLKKKLNWDATIDSHIEIIDSVTVRGYRFSNGWARNQRVYFQTRFSRPYTSVVLDSVSMVHAGKKTGMGVIAHFSFDIENEKEVLVKTAISGVSMKGAEKNLLAEAARNDFDFYKKRAQSTWQKEIDRITVKGGTEDQRKIFYTALYHSMLAPTIFGDVDGQYFGPDRKIHQAKGWTNYSTFSLWDTYRTSHPLFTYTQPKRVNDMVHSLVAFYEQSGRLPVWNMYASETDMMIGYHSVPVIVDAYLKGLTDVNPEKALEACVNTANIDDYRAIGWYKKLGYVPYNKEHESVSKTLEYAFDDYCIALMAEKMGKKGIAETFFKRADFYKNIYNPATSFMQPRDDKGVFIKDFEAKEYTEHITESNGWQYFWYVPQDVDGLISLVGGKQRFTEKLDSMFTYNPTKDDKLPLFSTGMIGQYAQGNEPSHHVIYLYNSVDQPAKTQKYVAEVMQNLYLSTPGGLCGNDDCGQTSAWYVMSAMGFYPVCPVGGKYEIGTPLFPELKLHLENGKILTILAPEVSKENIYVKSIKINGETYNKSYITHDMILNGATIEFQMTNKPCDSWYK